MEKSNDDYDMNKFDWVQYGVNIEKNFKEETFTEKFHRKFGSNPFIPIGCALTAGALVFGLVSFRRGDNKTSQFMMRCRIAAQGFTLLALIGSVIMASRKPPNEVQT